jgi:diaminohydroxyphosphoribosylaminopyrimidine deaminase / 5-amino-6-(5-phosphoribosylamino)uracil reductase
MASGESQWITGDAARADAHRLRAEAGAVLTSAQTVIADDPALTVRTPLDGEPPSRPPDRFVIDTSGRVAASAKVWSKDGARRIRIACNGPGAPPDGVADVRVPFTADGRADLGSALAALASHDVNSVLVECGSVLAGALLRAGLVDELIVYLAPTLLGSATRGLVEVPGLEHLADRIALQFTDVRRIGDDLRITATPIAS